MYIVMNIIWYKVKHEEVIVIYSSILFSCAYKQPSSVISWEHADSSFLVATGTWWISLSLYSHAKLYKSAVLLLYNSRDMRPYPLLRLTFSVASTTTH
jgi:hypothetical protein